MLKFKPCAMNSRIYPLRPKKPGFYLICGLEQSIVVKNPVSEPPRVQDYSCLCYDILKKQILLRGESMTTLALSLTYTQLLELVQQLPSEKQAELCEFLLKSKWGWLSNFTKDSEANVRMACWKRGKDWDTMTEEEREEFIDDVLHKA